LQLVGYAQVGPVPDNRNAFLYTSGAMIDLNNLVSTASDTQLREATAINDAGQIVGTALIHGVPHAYLLTVSIAQASAKSNAIPSAVTRRRH
jgi:hypothetical protein